MNLSPMARTAYAAAAMPVRTDRGNEYEAFARITARIKAASAKGAAGFATLAQALHDNRRLWTLLAADVAETQNGLGRDLRARIFYLAEFTLQHTSKVLNGSAGAQVLIDINSAVMSGLRNDRGAP